MSHFTLDVATLGEAMTLFAADSPGPLEAATHFTKYAAGAEINVAIGLARLGFRVGWASRLGSDSLARFILAKLQADGVDCSHVALDDAHPTGFQFKGRTMDGSDPVVEYHRKGSAASHMGPQDIDVAWLRNARHLHLSGVFAGVSASTLEAQQHALGIAHGAGRTVSFDPNLRPSMWRDAATMRTAINALAIQADWVLPGLAEGRLLTGHDAPADIAAFYLTQGVKLVVVKLGADGAYYASDNAGSGHIPAVTVRQVIDTVGAGDAFAVGVISGLLDGRSLVDSVHRACWCGACQVQVAGDSEGLPTRAELRAAGY